MLSDSSPFSVPRDDASEILLPVRVGHDLLNPESYPEKDVMDSNIDIFDKIDEAFTKAEKYQHQAFDESVNRQKVEEELILNHRELKDFEDMPLNDTKQRREVEETLAKANENIEILKEEMDALKQDRDDIIDKLVKMSEQKATLEQQVSKYHGIVRDVQDMLAASRSLMDSQQMEYEQLKHKRDNALKDADELRKEKEKVVSCSNLTWNTEFSLLELQQATQNFSDTMKVGEGGFGRVYRGLLCNTSVAIKILCSHNVQGRSQF
ncbi:hypothetical protein ACP70R_034256 [Stipagrostis hirtigluma subsp. patula]